MRGSLPAFQSRDWYRRGSEKECSTSHCCRDDQADIQRVSGSNLVCLPSQSAFGTQNDVGQDQTNASQGAIHNPHLVQSQHDHLEIIGRTNAHWFDHFGFDYFTREIFDWFYPGYGDSWPAFYGAAASTYEQASTRGLLYRQRDGDLRLVSLFTSRQPPLVPSRRRQQERLFR